jgi:hypothetical protein
MKHISKLAALLTYITLTPSPSLAASIPDLSGFHQPISKCQKPAENQIITQVGTFPSTLHESLLQIVASVRPSNTEITITDHATISIFDNQCHLIYQQVFPGAGEATFETIQWDGQTLLHLVTVSAVSEPADETIYNHIFLTQNYDGSLLPVQPPSLTSDKYVSIFVGDIGSGKGFGIVETFQPGLGQDQALVTPFSVMFRLQDFQLPESQSISAFVGPTLIQVPAGKDKGTAWPDSSYATGFPLMHYLFGNQSG